MSGARPALWTYSREHRDTWSRQTAAVPPNRHNRFRGKPSTAPWVFTSGLHGLPGLSRILTPPCVTGRRGMSPFSRDFYLIDLAVQPARCPDTRTGPELPLSRREQVVEHLLGLDAIAPSPGCGSPEGGRYCRLGAHRRPMPGGRLVRIWTALLLAAVSRYSS